MGSALARLNARQDLTAAAAVVLIFAVQAVIRFNSPLGHDVAWYLYAGERLLDGARLYEDIVEVNPPLALWLSMPVAIIARTLGIAPAVVLKTVLLLLTGISIALSARFISAGTGISAGGKRLLVVLLAALLLFMPGADFGQREHVAVVLVAPFVPLLWNRLLDREVPVGLAAATGLLAAVGFWLKPHFVLAFAAIELVAIAVMRSFRPALRVEAITVAAFGALYLAAVSFLFSRHLVAMSSLSTRAYIPIYSIGFEEVARRLILPAALAAAAAASSALLSAPLQLLRTLLVIAGALFVSAFIVQAGHGYQLMPALFFLAFAAGLGPVLVLAGDVPSGGAFQRIVAAGSAVAVALVFFASGAMQSAPYHGGPFERAIAVEAPAARSLFIASTSVAHPFPLVGEKRLVWASRFPAQWLAPYVATRLDPKGGPTDSVGRFALEATVSDLLKFSPDIVFVDENSDQPYYSGAGLDHVAFWTHDPRFEAFWLGYERRGSVEGFAVYVRRNGG